MVFRFLSVVAVILPLCTATSYIIGYSTQSHFLCDNVQKPVCDTPHQQIVSQSQLPSVFRHLSTGNEATSQLPLSQITTSQKPEIVLHIAARHITSSPSSILRRISVAVSKNDRTHPQASSFQATTDVTDPTTILSNTISVKAVDSVTALQKLADENSSILSDDVTDYVSLNVNNEDDQGIISALHTLSSKTDGKLAVIWTVRDDTTDDKDKKEDKKEDSKEDSKEDEKKDSTKADDAKEKTDASYTNTMNPPEINVAQLTGLLVTATFLIIFIPGFMCLWNIQSPQSFEIFSSENLIKKIQ